VGLRAFRHLLRRTGGFGFCVLNVSVQTALNPSKIEYINSTIQNRLGNTSKVGKVPSKPPVFSMGPTRAPTPMSNIKLDFLGLKSACKSFALIMMTTETRNRMISVMLSAKLPTGSHKLPYQFCVMGQKNSIPPVKKSPIKEWDMAAT
jgi:hypothetical protein